MIRDFEGAVVSTGIPNFFNDCTALEHPLFVWKIAQTQYIEMDDEHCLSLIFQSSNTMKVINRQSQ